MATKKQMEARIKKLQTQLSGNVKAKTDLVATATEWCKKKLKAEVVSKAVNVYTTKDAVEHKGVVLVLDNGNKFQVGEQRFWKIRG